MKIPFNKTKIVATVGPASISEEMLHKLIESGVDCFRLNFSHGSHEDHLKVIEIITKFNSSSEQPVSILADLQGPKIRLGDVATDNQPIIKAGDLVTLTTTECVSSNERIFVNYKSLAEEVQKGERILIDDGKIELEAKSSNGKDEVQAKVIYGGEIKSRKGVNLPDTNLSVPALTEKDKKDLKFILTQPINWVALSFVRTAEEIISLKNKIKDAEHNAKVIAKIEKPQALTNIGNIIEATDGIMIARGDLGVEVEGAKVPLIQKDIIRRCNKYAKPVIVATQMMESMIENAKPTRAEINDVANAVIDGTDAVMLSGETAVGKYPTIVINTITRILESVENNADIYFKALKPNKSDVSFLTDAVCYNACELAKDINAKAILGVTVTGYTAYKTSSNRPRANIYIFTENKTVLSTLNLVWGVRAFYYDEFKSTDETIKELYQILIDKGLARKGDILINLGTMPLAEKGKTNMLRIGRVE